VADNQAIDAFKKADNRRKNNKFDLFIATDVTSYLMDGYTLPLEKKGWLSRFSLVGIIITWLLLSAALPVHAHPGRPTLALQPSTCPVARTVHAREGARAGKKATVAGRTATG
jgi:hypothetical protein